MERWRSKLLALSGSTLLGLALAALWWNNRPVHESVILVESREELDEILTERSDRASTTLEPRISSELLRFPIPEEDAHQLFATMRFRNRYIYDVECIYWEVSNLDYEIIKDRLPRKSISMRTNSLGFRTTSEPSEKKPDLRIIVTGDSHTAGVVQLEDMFANRLQAELLSIGGPSTIESFNGGKGGFSFYNYVGVLEKFLFLDPDVFVVAIYGGNDFGGVLNTYRYFHSLPPPPPVKRSNTWKKQGSKIKGMISQDLNQLMYFHWYPDEIEQAKLISHRFLNSILRIGNENSIDLIFVYIPPLRDCQPQLLGEPLDDLIENLGLSPQELDVTNRLADDLQAKVIEHGIPWIDMRLPYRESSESCYEVSDLHINSLGNRLIAEALRDELSSRVSR